MSFIWLSDEKFVCSERLNTAFVKCQMSINIYFKIIQSYTTEGMGVYSRGLLSGFKRSRKI